MTCDVSKTEQGEPAHWMPGRPVPHSSGTARPLASVPRLACDAHVHVIDPRYLMTIPGAVHGMTLDDYLVHQARLGTRRTVFVQAKPHGIDNNCLLDALERCDGTARGIAVVHPDVSDVTLRRLDAAGVRGLRFSLWKAADTVTTIDMVEPLARRIAELGWHAQLHMSADQIVAQANMLDRLMCPLVFDHMARLPSHAGPRHPAFDVVHRLVDKGRTWVKLSGAYLETRQGPPDYADIQEVAQSFVVAMPDRLVWGSDWPHVTEARKPDDARLIDLLRSWVPDQRTFEQILVNNPGHLYRFSNQA